MKFTVEKTEFEKALFNVIRVADEKTGLYIKAEADTVTVIGTDPLACSSIPRAETLLWERITV